MASPNSCEGFGLSEARACCRGKEDPFLGDVVVVTCRGIYIGATWHCFCQLVKSRSSLSRKLLRVGNFGRREGRLILDSAVAVNQVRELPRIKLRGDQQVRGPVTTGREEGQLLAACTQRTRRRMSSRRPCGTARTSTSTPLLTCTWITHPHGRKLNTDPTVNC